jgi:hypothetical protein
MATTSFTAPRRYVGFAFVIALLLFSFCMSGEAVGQGTTPLVIASSPSELTYPSGIGGVIASVVDQHGNWLFADWVNGALYEVPAGTQTAITLAAPGTIAAGKGGYAAVTLMVDPGNNLYLSGNWSNCMVMFPWDAATGAWDGLASLTTSKGTSNICGTYATGGGSMATGIDFGQGGSLFPSASGKWGYQPWGAAVGNNNNLIVASQAPGNFIFSANVKGGWTNPSWNGLATIIIDGLTKRANSVAQDPEGNVYFVEDSGGLSGLYEIPAGATGLTSDADPRIVRVDPNLPAVTGVMEDASGNLYVSDSKQGVYFIPNPSGTPQTAAAVQLTPLTAVGEVAIDWARNIMYVPTNTNGSPDFQAVAMGYAEFGSSPVGTATATGTNISLYFPNAVTANQFVIEEPGAANPDFAITGGSCVLGTAFAAGSSCTEVLAMTPHSVGNLTARLLIQQRQANSGKQSDVSDKITQYSVDSKGNATFTAANTLTAGETVIISDSSTGTGSLSSLNGKPLIVSATGLSGTQFEVLQLSLAATTSPVTSSATVTAQSFYTLASTVLHGVGQGATIQISPAQESTYAGGLKTPSQIALDALGNTYVADAGQGKLLMFAQGAATGTAIGSGLVAPTGVAVDGAGDVFVADSGNVYDLSYSTSLATGAPTTLNGTGQQTLLSGLGASLQLAADGVGNVYVADPTNNRVVKVSNFSGSAAPVFDGNISYLTTGLTTPSAVAVDALRNLYVVDGSNLFEFVGGTGSPVTLLAGLAGVTGLAVDPSGAVYLTSGSTTERIPLVSGALAIASETAVASDVPSAASVVLDSTGNIYLAPTSGGKLTEVSISGTLNFGNVPLVPPAPAPVLPITLTNAGNSALTVKGYTSTNSVDYNASDISCEASAVAAGSTCTFNVDLVPGPGEQGVLSAVIGLTSTSINVPVVSVTANTAALAKSATSLTAGTPTQVISTPITVTVAPPAGTSTIPTGIVTVSYPSFTAPGGVLTQVTSTVSATLKGGVAQFTLAPISAGAQTITVNYGGDRVFGRSTGTLNVTVAKSNIVSLSLDPKPPSYLPFTLQSNGYTPYDGSQNYWEYSFPVSIATAAGLATGTITYNDDSSVCPPGTSATGQGAAACLLNGNKGVACSSTGSTGVQNLTPASGANTTGTSFNTSCLEISTANTAFKPIFGTHYLTPVYSGDANFNGFTGPVSTLFQVVQSPAVLITSNTPSLTIAAGSSGTATLALNSVLGYGFAGQAGSLNNYQFPLTLSCDNLPPHAECSFTYPTPDPTISNALDIACTGTKGSGATAACSPAAAAITIYTNVTAGTTVSRNAGVSAATLATIFGLGMFGLFFRRREFQKGRTMLMVFLALVGGALALSLTACSTTNLSPVASSATPSGTYSVTVTASETGSLVVQNAGQNETIYGNANQVSLPFYVNVTVQ